MDVIDAIDILKKYKLYDKAEAECKRKKIEESPYDMQGHHKIYCEYLSKKWVEIRDKKDELQKKECKKLLYIPKEKKPLHNNCSFAISFLEDDYCEFEPKCDYYDEIKKLSSDMKELSEAKKVLKDAAQKDFCLR